METQLLDGETVLYQGQAKWVADILRSEGYLWLTNYRLFFSFSGIINVHSEKEVSVFLEDIIRAEATNRWYVIPTGLDILTDNGTSKKFDVFDNQKWANLINRATTTAILNNKGPTKGSRQIPPKLSSEVLEKEISRKLPPELQAKGSSIAETIIDIVNQGQVSESTRKALRQDAETQNAMAIITKKQIETTSSVITFGEGNNIGDVNIRDVAGGNIFHININISISS